MHFKAMDGFSEFLKRRKIHDDVIKDLENDKIDCEAILLLEDDELKKFFPHYGDRIAVKDYCKTNSPANQERVKRKSILFQELEQKSKIQKKKGKTLVSVKVDPDVISEKYAQVTLGWHDFNYNCNKYRPVPSYMGGKARKCKLPENFTKKELVNEALELFFPKGGSKLGNVSEFVHDMRDFKKDDFPTGLSLGAFQKITKVKDQKFYLFTKKNAEPLLSCSKQNESNPPTDKIKNSPSGDSGSDSELPIVWPLKLKGLRPTSTITREAAHHVPSCSAASDAIITENTNIKSTTSYADLNLFVISDTDDDDHDVDDVATAAIINTATTAVDATITATTSAAASAAKPIQQNTSNVDQTNERKKNEHEELINRETNVRIMNEMRHQRKSLVPEEPEDGILFAFITTNGKFQRKFAPSSKIQDIMNFVGSLEESSKNFALYNPGNKNTLHSKHISGRLYDHGLNHPTLFHVQWGDDGALDEDPDETPEPTYANDHSYHKHKNTTVLKLKIHRSKIVKEVLKIYSENISDRLIIVNFVGEQGEDLNGLTKEMFCTFWENAKYKYFHGEVEYLPESSITETTPDVFLKLGRVMGHGFRLCGYIPQYLGIAFHKAVAGDEISEDELLNCILNVFAPSEKRYVLIAMDEKNTFLWNDQLYEKLVSIYSRFGCQASPKVGLVRKQVIDIARSVIVSRPLHLLQPFRKGLIESGHEISSEIIDKMLKRKTLTAKEVLNVLVIPKKLTFKEDKVLEYFITFIESSELADLSKLLQFITGLDVLMDSIKIEFNSLQGVARRISCNTCTNCVHLPVNYQSYSEFSKELKSIINNPYTYVFDAV